MRTLSRFWLFFLALSSIPAWAGYIRGQIRFENGALADNVIVRLRSDMIAFQTETTTDREGRFEFSGLSLTTYNLTIDFPGHHPILQHIDISTSRMDYENITLHRDRSKDEPNVPPEGAKATLSARLAQLPQDAQKEFDAGKARMGANDNIGAVSHFKHATELFPQYAEAYQLWGVVLMGTGDLAAAEGLLERAVAIESHLATAYFALGICRNIQGKYQLAEKALLSGLQLDPASFDGNLELAKTYFAIQRFDKAETYARKSITVQPKAANAYLLLGYVLLREAQPDPAKDALAQYLKLAPQGPAVNDVNQTIAMIEQHQRAVQRH